MTSTRLRRSSISLARNIGSGLQSLKETLLTSSMQDISEGHSSSNSTFYTDNEDVTEDENDECLDHHNEINNSKMEQILPSINISSEPGNISAVFESDRYS